MPYVSMLMITAHNETAREVAQIWIDRRCIEEAAESIPGFLRGEVLVHDESGAKVFVRPDDPQEHRQLTGISKRHANPPSRQTSKEPQS